VPHAGIAAVRVLVILLLLAGLSGDAVAQEQPSQASKSITVALAEEPEGLFNPTTPSGRLAANLVFDPLVGLDDHMQPYPVLAAQIPSPAMTGSGGDRRLVVTMPLREGVTWSDGEPFTADDVVYTWQLMENPQSGFDTRVEDKLRSVDKLDDLTVRFTYLSAAEARTSDPPVDPLAFFGLYDAAAIYPRHVLRQIIGDDPRHNPDVGSLATSSFARAPVGTGPYSLLSWDAGNSLVFASRGLALPQRLGRPPIDTLTLRILTDKNAGLSALQSGEVQLVSQGSLDANDAPVLDQLSGVQAFYTPGPALEQITFNLDNPPLGDVNVRRAIAQAINGQALNDAAMFGKAEVPRSLVPGWSWAAATDVPSYIYDPAQAEQALERAGWTRTPGGVRHKNGQPLSLSLLTSPAPFRAALTGALKDQLARVGIELNVETQPSSVVFDTRPGTPQALVARKFDLAELAWVSSYDPGADQVYTLHSSSVPTRGNGYQGGNYGNYRSSGSDDLLDQAQRSLDPTFRQAALRQAQAIWQTDLPALPLLVRPVVSAARPGLLNYRPSAASDTWNVEQWDLAP
jgi:peptide/nickel transport system substrate-binding protein